MARQQEVSPFAPWTICDLYVHTWFLLRRTVALILINQFYLPIFNRAYYKNLQLFRKLYTKNYCGQKKQNETFFTWRHFHDNILCKVISQDGVVKVGRRPGRPTCASFRPVPSFRCSAIDLKAISKMEFFFLKSGFLLFF